MFLIYPNNFGSFVFAPTKSGFKKMVEEEIPLKKKHIESPSKKKYTVYAF